MVEKMDKNLIAKYLEDEIKIKEKRIIETIDNLSPQQILKILSKLEKEKKALTNMS